MSREGKAGGRNPEMYGREKSDRLIVPEKSRNKAERPQGRSAADEVEERSLVKGNSSQQNALRTQSRVGVGNALNRVREVARRDRNVRFTALLHHVDVDRLRTVYLAMNRKAAAGVDGVTWEEYGQKLEENLRALHGRVHSGAYRVKPSRRVFIPKADGRERPLGIAALEDKIVQGAVLEVLNAIYEVDFLGFSYGFRPGRGQHMALDALAAGILRKKVNWVLDADIRDFFGSISHEWLLRFLEHRIGDRRVLRLIRQWLAAGVMEDGKLRQSKSGTPQGATISPLLSNVYLHYVLDLWINRWRNRQTNHDVIVVRWADDFVVGLQNKRDAGRLQADLNARLREFGLELQASKTRLVEFGRYAGERRSERGLGRPEVFTFLGLRHVCHSTGGEFQLVRHTDSKRLRAKLREVRAELKRRRHHSTVEQGAWLRSVIQGFYAYYAVPTNIRTLSAFRTEVARAWFAELRRRGDKDQTTWKKMTPRIDRWLPRARILHPWPDKRFAVRTQDRSRMR